MNNIRHIKAKAKYYSLIAEGKKAEWCIGDGDGWRESEPLWNLENSVYHVREKKISKISRAGLGVILKNANGEIFSTRLCEIYGNSLMFISTDDYTRLTQSVIDLGIEIGAGDVFGSYFVVGFFD